jgi:hypothetical protein
MTEFASAIGTIDSNCAYPCANKYLDSHTIMGYTTFIVDLLYKEVCQNTH